MTLILCWPSPKANKRENKLSFPKESSIRQAHDVSLLPLLTNERETSSSSCVPRKLCTKLRRRAHASLCYPCAPSSASIVHLALSKITVKNPVTISIGRIKIIEATHLSTAHGPQHQQFRQDMDIAGPGRARLHC